MSDTSDSDAVPHGTAVITIVKPPKLTSFSPEFLVEWTKKWEKFKRDLKEECTRTKRDYLLALPSIRSLAEPADLLDDMIEFSWHVSEEEATDEFVLKKMDEILAKPLNNAIPDAEKALASLKWDLEEKDVSMRVVRFLGGAKRLLKENALLDDLEGKSRRKKIIYILISKVKPSVLRDTLKQKVERVMDENATFGLPDLSKELLELSLENQRAFDAAKRHAKKPSPEKRKLEGDLSSGRENKRLRPDDGEPKLSRRERKRLKRRDHDGDKGGGHGGGDAGGNNPPPAGGKPTPGDKPPWKGNAGYDRRDSRGGRGRGRGDGGRGRGRGRPHNRGQQNVEPVDRDAGYHSDPSEPRKDQAKRADIPWGRAQRSNPETRAQSNEPAGEPEPAATGSAKARTVSKDPPEIELPASGSSKSRQKTDEIHSDAVDYDYSSDELNAFGARKDNLEKARKVEQTTKQTETCPLCNVSGHAWKACREGSRRQRRDKAMELKLIRTHEKFNTSRLNPYVPKRPGFSSAALGRMDADSTLHKQKDKARSLGVKFDPLDYNPPSTRPGAKRPEVTQEMSDPEFGNNSGDDGYLTPEEYSGKSEEEKAAEKRRVLRKAKVNQVLNNPTGEKRLNLNGVLDVPYCADTGATLNIIPQQMVWELKKLQPGLKVASVPADRNKAEGPDGQELELIGRLALMLTICTAAGPVRVPNAVACYITTYGTEFLVSDDTLKSIGIDVNRLLEQVAERQRLDEGDDLVGKDAPKFDLDVMLDDVVDAYNSIDQVEIPEDTEPERVRSVGVSSDHDGVTSMLNKAIQAGFPQDRAGELEAIVRKADVWRTKFRASDPPAKVPPMEITLKSDAHPYRCASRKVNPLERRFLDDFCETLKKAGVIWKNDQSKYCSPVNPVLKPEGKKMVKAAVREWTDEEILQHFRLTIDYRVINSMTIPCAGAMPFQVEILENVKDAKVLATFDLIKVFWQMPLEKASQEILSFQINGKIMTPSRVMQGHVDSALYFQKTMNNVFSSLLMEHLLVWIDRVLLYAKSIDDYLQILEKFLCLAESYRLKLNPLKCSLYNTEVKWCGRIIDGNGVRHDPDRLEALSEIPFPENAGQLQQFLCATNWMRDHIPEYAQLVAPLTCRLDDALIGKKRRKRIATSILITLTPEEERSWKAVRAALRSMVELAHPRDDATMCLFTDASNEGWSIIVTQVRDFSEDKPIHSQRHELLTCMSGRFKGAQLQWSVIEKEAYPIARACSKLNYLLMRPQGFRMYCDHKNLIHVFAPDAEWKAHTRGKLMRWADTIGEYRYVIHHIDGEHNVWADMMSRWGHPPPPKATIRRLGLPEDEIDSPRRHRTAKSS